MLQQKNYQVGRFLKMYLYYFYLTLRHYYNITLNFKKALLRNFTLDLHSYRVIPGAMLPLEASQQQCIYHCKLLLKRNTDILESYQQLAENLMMSGC